jgi:hypothetical protein
MRSIRRWCSLSSCHLLTPSDWGRGGIRIRGESRNQVGSTIDERLRPIAYMLIGNSNAGVPFPELPTLYCAAKCHF